MVVTELVPIATGRAEIVTDDDDEQPWLYLRGMFSYTGVRVLISSCMKHLLCLADISSVQEERDCILTILKTHSFLR